MESEGGEVKGGCGDRRWHIKRRPSHEDRQVEPELLGLSAMHLFVSSVCRKAAFSGTRRRE